MRATFLYPQGEEENSQECRRAEKKGPRSWWRTGNNAYKTVVRKEAAGREK